ncbi:hypothetical protein L2E82_31104 [Cichorium intybus]|uniref:Uncharacterized protein n=1 Tax=Cichorium intybus TaxID=13427 RepID=A0ACB9D216_CICIN|nr:hypothetical protein L2E82_31104 [Cichorium intybus]
MKRHGENCDEEGWTKVQNRRWNHQNVGRNDKITTFFVTGLPDGVDNRELKEVCKRVSHVVEVRGQEFAHKLKPLNEKSGLRDGRTFAEAIKGRNSHDGGIGERSNQVMPLKSIHLNEVSHMKEWFCSPCNLVGELLSIDNLRNLPTFLTAVSLSNVKLHYIHGLAVFMVFDSPDEALGFLNNRSSWDKNFLWIKPGEIDMLRFERLAWIQCVGIPIHVRDETNMKTKFNEEMQITVSGKSFKIGVVEVDYGWNPFNYVIDNDYLESNDMEEDDGEEDDYDSDKVSDTWVNGLGGDGLEEGEIHEDNLTGSKSRSVNEVVPEVSVSPVGVVASPGGTHENMHFLNGETDVPGAESATSIGTCRMVVEESVGGNPGTVDGSKLGGDTGSGSHVGPMEKNDD